MLSKFRTLLVAGAVLPLAAGFAFAQSASPTTAPVANPPAASASTTTSKELGALKATPAEKKATHEKTSAATPSGKTASVKTAAIAPKHHVVKKHAVKQTGATSSVTGKTASPAATAPKADDAAKKL